MKCLHALGFQNNEEGLTVWLVCLHALGSITISIDRDKGYYIDCSPEFWGSVA